MFIYTENDPESDKRIKKITTYNTKHAQNTQMTFANPKNQKENVI